MEFREPLLTKGEHEAIRLCGDLAKCLSAVVGGGPTSSNDFAEVIGHVHDIQARVMSNAAARAYPTLYRKLGGMLHQPTKER